VGSSDQTKNSRILFSPICFHQYFSVEKENKSLIFPKSLFFSLEKNQNKYYVMLEKKIGENKIRRFVV
jgi:hypothetical protein